MVSVALLVAAGPERSRFDPEGEIWPEKGFGRLERLRTAALVTAAAAQFVSTWKPYLVPLHGNEDKNEACTDESRGRWSSSGTLMPPLRPDR